MLKLAQAIFIGITVLWSAGAAAANKAIEKVCGEYAGRTVSTSAEELKARDINVEIKEI